MESKKTYNTEHYLKYKESIYKATRKYSTKEENKEHIAELKKNYYIKKKDDPEYKQKHAEAMKKYYNKK